MTAVMPGRARIGRPPDTDPAETRQRIVDAARAEFAAHGFAAATNRTIAAAARVTTGAVYHHFGSKVDLYVAVHQDAHDRVYERFARTAADHDGFAERFGAVLAAAADLNADDPTLAAFIGASRVDRRRHPELATVLPDDHTRRSRFFGGLIDDGVRAGEISQVHRDVVAVYVDTVVVGLNDAVSDDIVKQRRAIHAVDLAMRGLLNTSDSTRGSR